MQIRLITAAPLWVTWLVFDFLFTQLSRLGTPWVNPLARTLRAVSPPLADWLPASWFRSLLAGLLLLVLLSICSAGSPAA